MNLLTTFCKPGAGENRWDIFWRNGAQIQGVVQVTLTVSIDDPEIVAELSALQWLLEHRSVFGVSQAGKGLCLTVSTGAIKKLAKAAEKIGSLGKSNLGKPHLFPYARFLGTRFVGLGIDVSKDDSWIKPRSQNDIVEISITGPLPEILDIAGIGKVALSAHAMKRFNERLGCADRDDTWRLLRRLANGGLRMAPMDDERTRRQTEKYGSGSMLWIHDDTKWAFVIVTQEPYPVMVTAYAIKASTFAQRR